MNALEINKALAATGECEKCGGTGQERGDGSRRWHDCDACGCSGVDPRAQFRATQAVGHLLMRILDRMERPL